WVVLELSSFQLESVERPRFHVGVILNITPDHLDRHGTFERYVDIKARAIEFAGADDFAVLNGRDRVVRELASRTKGRVVWFNEHRPGAAPTTKGRRGWFQGPPPVPADPPARPPQPRQRARRRGHRQDRRPLRR